MTLLLNDGDFGDETDPASGLYSYSPFLELYGAEKAVSMKRPGAIKNHLPFSMQPWNEDAKYIVVIRNPMDALVSFYHHVSSLKAQWPFENATISDYLPHWLSGDIAWGSYFDWVLGWWRQKHRKNVIVFFYEEMKLDIRAQLVRLADFLAVSDKLHARNGELMEKIVAKSSVEHMQRTTNEMLKRKTCAERNITEAEFTFRIIRKGVIGDFKAHLNGEEIALIDRTAREKFKGTELETYWDRYNLCS